MNRWEPTYLQSLRRDLHRIPEPSGREQKTARRILEELHLARPDRLFEQVGGHGLIARFDSGVPGPHLAFRSELDGLPVRELSTHDHISGHPGSMHACGHDGHMAVMVGVAHRVSAFRPKTGSITFLFQPAEETGEGAAAMMADARFNELELDRLYAFHNIPGLPLGTLALRAGTFACASRGLRIRWTGVSSHAARPDQGRSPARPVARFMERAPELGHPDPDHPSYCFATTTYAQVGEPAFGTQPGEAEAGVTLRGYSDERVEELEEQIRNEVRQEARKAGIEVECERVEPFPAVINDPATIDRIRMVGRPLGHEIVEMERPWPWSEDVSWFGRKMALGFIGIGSGTDQPHLHSPRFDFPDRLLEPAERLFSELINKEWGA